MSYSYKPLAGLILARGFAFLYDVRHSEDTEVHKILEASRSLLERRREFFVMKLNNWLIFALAISAAILAWIAGSIKLYVYPAEPNMFATVPAGTFDLWIMPILAFCATFFGFHTAMYINEKPSRFAKALIAVGSVVAVLGLVLIMYALEQSSGSALGLELVRVVVILAGIFGAVIGFSIAFNAKYITRNSVDHFH